jgi:hypothetical protein
MLKLAKNAMIQNENTDSDSLEVRKRVNYLSLRISGVYIGKLQSFSRLLALNGFYAWICNRSVMIYNRSGL